MEVARQVDRLDLLAILRRDVQAQCMAAERAAEFDLGRQIGEDEHEAQHA